MKTVYLAGPMTGHSYDDVITSRDSIWRLFDDSDIALLDPMRGITESQYALNGINTRKIVARDLYDVRTCDAVLADFRMATKTSIGSCIELGYAHALGKPIVTLMGEDNPHWHAFINEISMHVTEDEAEAAYELTLILNPE